MGEQVLVYENVENGENFKKKKMGKRIIYIYKDVMEFQQNDEMFL